MSWGGGVAEGGSARPHILLFFPLVYKFGLLGARL